IRIAIGSAIVCERTSRIDAETVLDDQRTLADESAREAAAENTFAFAANQIAESSVKIGTPNYAHRRCKVVEVVLKRPLANCICAERWSRSCQRTWTKQIAGTRDVVNH